MEVTIDDVREFAFSLEGVIELPHFEKTSFRVKNRIFCTYNAKENRICLKLSEIDQDVFCSFDSSVVWKVPNKFGNQGWTLFSLSNLRKEMMEDAMNEAYKLVSMPKKKK